MNDQQNIIKIKPCEPILAIKASVAYNQQQNNNTFSQILKAEIGKQIYKSHGHVEVNI